MRRSLTIARCLAIAGLALVAMACETPPESRARRGPTITTGPVDEVVLLHSYHHGWRFTDLQDSVLHGVLVAGAHAPIRIQSEFLDAVSGEQEDVLRAYADVLRRRYESRHPRVVVTTDGPAARFMATHGLRVFPGVPVVFSAVDRATADLLRSVRPATGVVETPDPEPTIDLVLRVHPKVRRLVVLSDETAFGAQLRARTEQAAAALGDLPRVEYLTVSPQSPELALKAVAALPPDAVLFILSAQDYRHDDPAAPQSLLSRLAREASVPAYGLYDSYLGSGIVGGTMVSAEAQALSAGRMALRVLDGAPISQIPVEPGAMPTLVDERVLKRWGIDRAVLPVGTEHRFRERRWWEINGRLAVLLLLVFVAQGAFIVSLVAARRRARRLLVQVREQQDQMERIGEIARIGRWELDVPTGKLRWSAQAYAIHELDPSARPDLARATSFYARAAQPVFAGAVDRALTHGESFDVELLLTTARGAARWVRAVGIPELVDGRCRRLAGIFQDLTERRDAASELHASDARLRAVVASIDDLVFVLDADGRIGDFYQSAERKDLLMPPQAFLGRLAVEVLPPAASVPFAEAMDALKRGVPTVHFEYVLAMPGGERWFNCRISSFAGPDGQLAGMTAVVRDITDNVRDAEALRASEERARASADRLEETVRERTSALKAREAELRAVIELLPVGLAVWRVDDGTVLEVNEAFSRLLGDDASAFAGRSWWDLVAPSTRGRDRLACAALGKTGEGGLPPHESELLDADGVVVPVRLHCRLVEQGVDAMMVTLAVDLREASAGRQLFHDILEAAPDAMVVSDAQGRILFANMETERLVGWSRAELQAMQVEKLVPDAAHGAHEAQRAAFMVASRYRPMGKGRVLAIRHRDGTEIDAELSLSHVQSTWQGGVVVIAIRDVRERTRLEQEVQRVSRALDAALTAIAFTDVTGRLTKANPAAMALFGYEDSSEVLGRHYSEFFAFPEVVRGAQESILRSGTAHGRATLRDRSGRLRIADYLASRIEGVDGAPVGMMASFIDVTALTESERWRREAERVASIGSWELDHGTGVLQWSDEIYRIFELDSHEFTPSYQAFLAQVHPDDRALVDQAFTTSVRHRTPYDIVHRLRTADGRVKHVRERCETTFGADGAPQRSLGTVQDITDVLSTEETLRQQDELLRSVVAAAPLFVFGTDSHGRVRVSEGPALASLGRSPGEGVGALAVETFAPLSGMADAIGRALAGETVRLETRGSGRSFDAHLSPVVDREGRPAGIVCVALDTTNTTTLHEQLQQMQKMEAVGHLAGGVAHDFNNLLMVIMGHADELAAAATPGSVTYDSAAGILAAGDRAASLTRQLLAFSRRQVLSPEVVVLRDAVLEAAGMIGRLIGPQFALVTLLDLDVPPVEVDRGQLDQILMNLAVNARDAMGERGTLTLRTRRSPVPPRGAFGQAAAASGDWAVLEVSDTGHGMSVETQARIFEPFFTTKSVGVGTGLGLSVVLGIVEQSGGTVEVTSELGAGTTFSVWFPASRRRPTRLRSSDPVGRRAVAGTETILLAEDEVSLRRMMHTALEREGYQVLEAPDGLSALGLVERFPGRIDLLITDVVMPGMSGPRFVELALELRPDLRVLLVTGHPLGEVLPSTSKGTELPLMRKPFTLEQLLAEVRRVLDGRDDDT